MTFHPKSNQTAPELTLGKRLLINETYNDDEKGFNFWFDKPRMRSLHYVEWLDRFSLDVWMQHKDEGRRWGHMTTNISVCMNTVLKRTRFLPISAIRLIAAIEESRSNLQFMRVTHWDWRNSVFLVEDGKPGHMWGHREYCVMFNAQRCDYSEFQAFH
ncbi:hypothetical protein PIB30_050580 [Stylosanthes scabra]|uniref:Uncharacterized protein n=1 Tax=Stylosanthes scabra TaxID=79078 RepID=A0ABU6TI35_9FABA|nr:hypothetical protein [Stylosanthes scabra]